MSLSSRRESRVSDVLTRSDPISGTNAMTKTQSGPGTQLFYFQCSPHFNLRQAHTNYVSIIQFPIFSCRNVIPFKCLERLQDVHFPKSQRMCGSGTYVFLFTSCKSKTCRQNCPCHLNVLNPNFFQSLSVLIDSRVSGFSCDKSLEALKHLGKI